MGSKQVRCTAQCSCNIAYYTLRLLLKFHTRKLVAHVRVILCSVSPCPKLTMVLVQQILKFTTITRHAIPIDTLFDCKFPCAVFDVSRCEK